ncbi:hypothetical protein [Nitrospina watsonii]|uniref:Uncharacterized protein n=1 Tax=Nitrospina watsonii TaxID=1323948 RepID=A0ABM9HFR4_9BACT|nr:hypothetical protein [Nitrospina watsonii]CAI2719003.1 conserved protein of unknown function [Nitrospina watsonii]
MNRHRQPLLILTLTLLLSGLFVENALARCLFSGFGLSTEFSQWTCLAIMVLLTGTIFYKKFIEPDATAITEDETGLALEEPAACEREPQHSAARELKIGQNFSSWARLSSR